MRRAPDVRPEVPRWSGAPAGLRSAFLLQHEPRSVSPVPASAPGRFLLARASAAQAAPSARAGFHFRLFLRLRRRDLLLHCFRLRRLGRWRGVSLLHHRPRRQVHRRRLRRRRCRSHVHHDRGHGDPRQWMLCVPGKTEREQCRMQADDRRSRRSPTEYPAPVADIVQNESVHGDQLRPSRPTRATLR